MPAYRISLGFSRWKPGKNSSFLYGFSRAQIFTARLKPKFVKIANGTTWYRDIVRLPLTPTQYFKPRNVKKNNNNSFFVFLWIWPEPMRGRQRKKISRKRLWKPNKFLPELGRHLFYFQTCFRYFIQVCCFYLVYPSLRSVKAKKGKTLTPTRTEVFGWPQWTGKE